MRYDVDLQYGLDVAVKTITNSKINDHGLVFRNHMNTTAAAASHPTAMSRVLFDLMSVRTEFNQFWEVVFR